MRLRFLITDQYYPIAKNWKGGGDQLYCTWMVYVCLYRDQCTPWLNQNPQ